MIILILFSALTSLHATSYTPLELARVAQERAPIIKMYLEQQNAAQSQTKQARILANPTLTYQGGAIKAATDRGAITDLTLMQPVPWLGKRSGRIKSSEFLFNLSKLDTLEAKLMLGHRVYLLGHRLAHHQEMEKYNQQRKERFALITRYLSSRPLASPRQSLEKDLIESQMRLVEKTMTELTSTKKGLNRELTLLTDVDSIDVKIDWNKLPPSHEQSYYTTQLPQGLRMQKMQENIKLAENRIEEARLEARPDIMVGVNYRQENVSPVNHFYAGQVAVVLPILDRGQHSVGTARANLKRDEANLKLTSMEVESDFTYAWENLKASKRGVELYPVSLIKESHNRFEKALDAFKKGQIDVMTFLQSDTQISENINQVYLSRLEYLESLSAIEQLIGHSMEQI